MNIGDNMGLLKFLLAMSMLEDEDKDKKEEDSELMPWEQDLVDRGEYTPDQFEEEDMDEDKIGIVRIFAKMGKIQL